MNPASLPRRALLLDDARPGGAARLFRDPVEWIEARDPAAALAALGRIDAAVQGGLWVAGSFAFELGYLLEPKLRPLFRPPPDPLIAVGVYRAPEPVDGAVWMTPAGEAFRPAPAEPSLGRDAYAAAFDRVRDAIAAGDVYQINLTFPLAIPFTGEPLSHLARWRAAARAGYAAIQRLDDRDVISFSPELFVSSEGDGMIRTRPMKGTVARDPDPAADRARAAALPLDEKQRAENLMIVDLLRNDLSRICAPGAVRTTDLFTVETYPTLHTMTSGVEGRLRPGLATSDVLRALFPCGSVTGAPKIRAMEIIAETEAQPRGVYCGAVGAIGPGLRMNLNVAIRTMVRAHGADRLRMGVGSGVVFDSEAAAEYDECLLKARFAVAPPPLFDVLETLRWSPAEGFLFLEEHLARLASSAAWFGRPCDGEAARAALARHVAPFGEARRVRLLLDATGAVSVESAPLEGAFAGLDPFALQDEPLRLKLVAAGLASSDPFVRHKTTNRAVYDAALAEARAAGADEAVLLNERGAVADGSYMSLFVKRGPALATPRLADGALDGVLRRAMIAGGAPPVVEATLTPDDLRDAEAIYLGNSVRGLRRARLITAV